MILNFANWKELNEQTDASMKAKKVTTQTIIKKWTSDPESLNIMKMFNTEFLPSVLGKVDDLTVAQYIDKLSALTTDQFNSAIQFFKNKGYAQPNDKIKKFQEDLMQSTNYSTFTTSDDKTRPFNDGIFGHATSAAIVNFMIQKLKNSSDQTAKVKDLYGAASSGGIVQQAAKVGTTPDVKTGTGVQTL